MAVKYIDIDQLLEATHETDSANDFIFKNIVEIDHLLEVTEDWT